MIIKFSRKFRKQYKKSPDKIKKSFDSRLSIFLRNPSSSVLNNHKLTGRLSKYRSINVTGDWRVIYSEYKSNLIVFEMLGTHAQLYE